MTLWTAERKLFAVVPYKLDAMPRVNGWTTEVTTKNSHPLPSFLYPIAIKISSKPVLNLFGCYSVEFFNFFSLFCIKVHFRWWNQVYMCSEKKKKTMRPTNNNNTAVRHIIIDDYLLKILLVVAQQWSCTVIKYKTIIIVVGTRATMLIIKFLLLY